MAAQEGLLGALGINPREAIRLQDNFSFPGKTIEEPIGERGGSGPLTWLLSLPTVGDDTLKPNTEPWGNGYDV